MRVANFQSAQKDSRLAISFNKLELCFGKSVICSDFSTEINHGEFIAILGANGAGKSTLLRAVLGLIPANQGQILLFNQLAKKGSPFVGYMPQVRQQHSLTSSLSGLAWLAANFNGFKWGFSFSSRQKRQELARVVQLVGAEKIVSRPYSLLSGGERQRLLLAQSLLNKPKILLLDEPLMNLDPYYQETLVTLVNTIRSSLGVTVLFTSHDINPLLGRADRVLYLAKGKAAIGLVDEIITSEKLSELYSKAMHVMHYKQQIFVINKETGFYSHVNCQPDVNHFSG